VLILVFVHFALKSVDISFKDLLYCHLSLLYVIIVIVAITMLVALALWATSCIVSQAFAVQLEAFSVLTFAALTSYKARLELLFVYKHLLSDGSFHN
jgi:hypothetical protein